MSLNSHQDETLDEICIDVPTIRPAPDTCSSMRHRSYSHPEIHVISKPFAIRPDELSFSSKICRTTSDMNWGKTNPIQEPFYAPTTIPPVHHAVSRSALSECPSSPIRPTGLGFLTRYDPSTVEERMRSMQCLLAQIYQEDSPYSIRDLPDTMTDSFQSDISHASPRRLSLAALQVFDRSQLLNEITVLMREIERANHRLVRVVRQRSFFRAKYARNCAILSAILMANSSKTSADSKLRFCLEPPTHEDVEEWKRAMRVMARLPGGLPNLIRCKLWSALGDLYIQSAGYNWEDIQSNAFSEKVQPDDMKIHSQILKDLHRTGWSEFEDERKLKQVLLGYARFNKIIGYCQGFNVIAALILQVVDYRPDIALKIMIFLIEHVMPQGYFDQSLGALSVDMIVMKDLMLQRLPTTIQHLETLQSSSENEYEPPLPNIFSMHWFLTLFSTCLPRDCVMRVWDALMLQGSEVLLRTAIAIWSKMSRRILRTSSADEFYTLMGKLCKELAEMNQEEQDHLMTVIYTMAEFPYPGLAELREKHRWNIRPLTPPFKLARRSADDILHDGQGDGSACSPCNLRRKIDNWNGLRSLEKQFRLTKRRQKQAAVIMNNAYLHGLNAHANHAKSISLPVPLSPPVFNHLLMGPALARDGCFTNRPTTLSGGAMQLAATVIQPIDYSARISRANTKRLSLTHRRHATRNGWSNSLSLDKGHESDALEEERAETPPVYIPAVKSEEQQNGEYREKLRRSKTMLKRVTARPALRHSLRHNVQSKYGAKL
ncbi:Rab-GAP TBC domain-containing protein [Trichostrongylus colubriformis]|uniref:Rab-GAP TBC domain-containing protein n=1 Tax=Trichostrongylus colubriformis TaxID=6319 RepID=A0AAN8ESH6_TRICO